MPRVCSKPYKVKNCEVATLPGHHSVTVYDVSSQPAHVNKWFGHLFYYNFFIFSNYTPPKVSTYVRAYTVLRNGIAHKYYKYKVLSYHSYKLKPRLSYAIYITSMIMSVHVLINMLY